MHHGRVRPIEEFGSGTRVGPAARVGENQPANRGANRSGATSFGRLIHYGHRDGSGGTGQSEYCHRRASQEVTGSAGQIGEVPTRTAKAARGAAETEFGPLRRPLNPYLITSATGSSPPCPSERQIATDPRMSLSKRACEKPPTIFDHQRDGNRRRAQASARSQQTHECLSPRECVITSSQGRNRLYEPSQTVSIGTARRW